MIPATHKTTAPTRAIPVRSRIYTLPDELTIRIMQHLDAASWLDAAQVSRRFHRLAHDRQVYRQVLGTPVDVSIYKVFRAIHNKPVDIEALKEAELDRYACAYVLRPSTEETEFLQPILPPLLIFGPLYYLVHTLAGGNRGEAHLATTLGALLLLGLGLGYAYSEHQQRRRTAHADAQMLVAKGSVDEDLHQAQVARASLSSASGGLELVNSAANRVRYARCLSLSDDEPTDTPEAIRQNQYEALVNHIGGMAYDDRPIAYHMHGLARRPA